MKAFFERLTAPGEAITTRDSVIRNVGNIFRFGSFLDAGVDAFSNGGMSEYHNGFLSVVDVSLRHDQQVVEFHARLAQLIIMHEPRIKDVQVLNMKSTVQDSYCQLKIFLHNEDFEQRFVFN